MELTFIDPGHPLYPEELELRYRVLRRPLGHGRDAVPTEAEPGSLHLVAVDDAGRVRGCVLFTPDGAGGGRLRQMAVDDGLQGRGLGRALVERLERELRARGLRSVTLHARETAVGFYARLGYAPRGGVFTEVGIPHREMHREL